MSEQRSDEWFEDRRGRFTASSIHRLLSDGSRPMTEDELKIWKLANPKSQKKNTECIGDAFYTLCFEKACEIVFGLDPYWDIVSYDMQRGINWEPDAFDLFKWNKLLDFIDVETCGFIPYGDNAGASPDGLVSDGGNLEIKCPKPPKFFTIIRDGKDAIDPEYISQMQMQMLATGRDHAYFFNYTIWQDRPLWHEIIVEGVIQRDKYVEILRNNKQF
jgi:hypothetical protein